MDIYVNILKDRGSDVLASDWRRQLIAFTNETPIRNFRDFLKFTRNVFNLAFLDTSVFLVVQFGGKISFQRRPVGVGVLLPQSAEEDLLEVGMRGWSPVHKDVRVQCNKLTKNRSVRSFARHCEFVVMQTMKK